jgi:hypothetical protein
MSLHVAMRRAETMKNAWVRIASGAQARRRAPLFFKRSAAEVRMPEAMRTQAFF